MKSADTFKIKMILGLFTVDRGKIKVYLTKKMGEPYKGHWSLLSKAYSYEETFSSVIQSLLEVPFGLEDIYTEDFQTFEDKETHLEDKMVHVSAIAIVDSLRSSCTQNDIEENENAWFDVLQLPKLAYNHAEIIEAMVSYLHKRLKDTDMIKILFPGNFTLPELQSFCEQLTGETLDRRNFRKKLFSLGILEDTNLYNTEGIGRPAKIYRFKEDIDEIKLF